MIPMVFLLYYDDNVSVMSNSCYGVQKRVIEYLKQNRINVFCMRYMRPVFHQTVSSFVLPKNLAK